MTLQCRLPTPVKTALLLGSLAAASAQAEQIEADWLASGDNLAMLDTATNLKWLDLTLTADMSIDQAQNALATTYQGWRLPTRLEVNTLLSNAMGSGNDFAAQVAGSTPYGSPGNQAKLLAFSNLLGQTGNQATLGIVLNDQQSEQGGTEVLFSGVNTMVNTLYDDLDFGSSDFHASAYGVYLVQAAPVADVALPAGLGALSLGLLGLVGRRRTVAVK